ncbi:MAG: hypothetical protein HOV87_01235 [Catenulispora sp.]|nr:hypothetical protein [Catenulispora sp.]
MTRQTSLRRLLVASCAGAATVVILPRAVPMLADTGLRQPAAPDDTEDASAAEPAQAPAGRSSRKTAALAVCLAYPSYRAWKLTRRLRARFTDEEN